MYLSFSLYLSSYLSLRSDINCLLPNLIRNFRRRDNLTSFLFSLTRSEPLLYRGLVPRIFLSIERVCERTSERPCSSLPIQFISLRSTHVVRSCLSLSRSPVSQQTRTGRKRVRQIGRRRVTARREWPSVTFLFRRPGITESVDFTRQYRKKSFFIAGMIESWIIFIFHAFYNFLFRARRGRKNVLNKQYRSDKGSKFGFHLSRDDEKRFLLAWRNND